MNLDVRKKRIWQGCRRCAIGCSMKLAANLAPRALTGEAPQELSSTRGFPFPNYRAFLASDLWRGLRAQRLQIDGRKCCRCGCRQRLQVHHHRYRETWAQTQTEDLRTLCRWCHAQYHGKQLPTQRKPNVKRRRKPEFLTRRPLTKREQKQRRKYAPVFGFL